jgi:glycosyltransferase involved in cell wall biosynthesis
MEEDKVKIVMTADTVGGVWTYCMDLCRVLEKYPVEIHLATMGEMLSEHQIRQTRQLNNLYVYQSNFKLEWMDNPWQDLQNASLWLHGIINQVKPDILHFNNYGLVCNFPNIPSVLVIHSCVLSWWRSVKNEPAPLQWNNYREMVMKAIEKVDIVVSPSFWLLDEFRAIYGEIPAAKVIYNARRFTWHEYKEKMEFIFSAGRIWDEGKNIKALEKASQNIKWPVFVAGDNSHPNTGMTFTSNNIILLGKLPGEKISEWMQKAGIYVSTAHYEPFGLSVLEAANAGCALVLSDIGSFRELWEGAALFVDPHDIENITFSINLLIENKELREQLSHKAKARSDFFDLEKMGEEYLLIYQNISKEFV